LLGTGNAAHRRNDLTGVVGALGRRGGEITDATAAFRTHVALINPRSKESLDACTQP
jgi:hypothetical protein